MRRLMWLSVGFGAICALCVYLPGMLWKILLGIPLMLLLVFALRFRKRHPVLHRMVYILAGGAAAICWFLLYQWLYLLPIESLHGKTVDGTFTASNYREESDYGCVVEGTCQWEGREYAVRLYLNEDADIQPGDILSGRFSLDYLLSPEGDCWLYHPGRGIFLIGYQEGDVKILPGDASNTRQFGARLAGEIKKILAKSLPEDVLPLAKGLLLGDKSGFDYETESAFRVSGISHVVAVSGLHVSVLYGFLLFLTFRRRFLTQILAVPVLTIFAAAVGFTPSVLRASVMICLLLLAQLCSREYDSPTALAVSALLILLRNPYTVSHVGFQLSVACVAGILLFAQPISRWMTGRLGEPKGKGLFAKLKRWVILSTSMTLSAMSLSTPLTAYYFGSVSIIGIVTNLLILWVIGFVFTGLILTCLVTLIAPGIGVWAGWVIAWPMRYVLCCARLLSKVPLAAVYTQSVYIVIWLVLTYLLLGVLLLRRGRHAGTTIFAIFLSLMIAAGVSWTAPMQDEVRVTVLDVGQGQCILLQSEGRTFLVDCGGDEDEAAADLAAEALRSQGISRLNGIILTHTDRDHSGGLRYLLTQIHTDCLLLPVTADPEIARSVSAAVQGETVYVEEDLSITYGETEIQVFAPIYASDTNENSLCVLFTRGNCAILVTGDRSSMGEAVLLREHNLPHVDLLVAGHHGAGNATSQALLEAVRPKIVVISVDENNRYGHPDQELLDRLASFGCTVYRTDEMGTIIFTR